MLSWWGGGREGISSMCESVRKEVRGRKEVGEEVNMCE